MTEKHGQPFACHGSEKMIYDVRQGPQAVCQDGVIYVAYHANPHGPAAHPHVVTHDLATGKWSSPVQIGEVPHYDHHFAPILWFDRERRIHVLFKCHGTDGGVHLISARPESIDEWTRGPDISPSISYPRLLHVQGGRLLLYYRAWGHMGFWTYQLSDDRGHTWTEAHVPLIDFDQNPKTLSDPWAGSYHSVCPGRDGRSLHIGFVYWDEQKRVNPRYKVRLQSTNRYHLYYLRLDIPTGELFTIDGNQLEPPVTRADAEQCKAWDTGHQLTNMPSILVNDRNEPHFVLPVSDATPWDCQFYSVKHGARAWARHPITRSNHTWSGAHLTRGEDGSLIAYLVVGDTDGATLSYGGGEIEEWWSADEGVSWQFSRKLVPEPGLLYNNPRPVELADGTEMRGTLVLFGWEGPGGLQGTSAPYAPTRNTGRAYLWHNGEWR